MKSTVGNVEGNNYTSIDIKATLKALHERFPNLTIDDLFDVLDCIKAEYTFTTYLNTFDLNNCGVLERTQRNI